MVHADTGRPLAPPEAYEVIIIIGSDMMEKLTSLKCPPYMGDDKDSSGPRHSLG